MFKKRVLLKGNWGTVEYAVNENDNYLAEKDLKKVKKKDFRQYSRLLVLFKHFAEIGEIKDISKFRPLKPDNIIFEFKRYPYRVACFFIPGENRCLLTHVFGKEKSKQYISKQKQKAKRIMKQHFRMEGIDLERADEERKGVYNE